MTHDPSKKIGAASLSPKGAKASGGHESSVRIAAAIGRRLKLVMIHLPWLVYVTAVSPRLRAGAVVGDGWLAGKSAARLFAKFSRFPAGGTTRSRARRAG